MIDNKQINEVDMTKQTIDFVGVSDGNDSFGFYFTTKETMPTFRISPWRGAEGIRSMTPDHFICFSLT